MLKMPVLEHFYLFSLTAGFSEPIEYVDFWTYGVQRAQHYKRHWGQNLRAVKKPAPTFSKVTYSGSRAPRKEAISLRKWFCKVL